ncbi:hypothetical protein HK100_002606 [Physocladia obscura]|uniref:DNA-directed RNA polymerase III subunit RPC9 n=1 Tax=Physocladia obscura TaxID=109957 RepID=A0AAD5XFA9_9FUNG|nr:hypothetical protein HK100_002606 [Physocladia obscura]
MIVRICGRYLLRLFTNAKYPFCTNNATDELRAQITRYLVHTKSQAAALALTPETASSLASKLKEFGLTKAEMIEELGNRYSEEQIDEMLALIQEYVATGQLETENE